MSDSQKRITERRCPSCGNAMLDGYMLSGGGRCWLLWYPKGKRPSAFGILKHGFPFFKKGSPEEGMVLHPWTDSMHYLPSYNCPECKMVLLDYDPDNAEES